MITVDMNGTYEAKKYGADKIALLGLFIVALLIARFVIVSRSAVVLSEPIKLNYAGLSASLPAGNGWRSGKQWKYEKNAFILSSFFDSGFGNVTGLAQCRYLLAAAEATPDTLFREKASAIGGAIAETGQILTDRPGSRFAKSSQDWGPLTIDWAHIKKPKTLFDAFFGTIQLPNNRQLNIEVYQTTGDTDLAKQVFERITESLKFEDNQLFKAGSEIVTAIKIAGLDRFLDNQSRKDFFLIKDVRKRTIGFTMDVLGPRFAKSSQNGGAQLNIQAASFYYIRGRYAHERATFFQSDNSFDEFIWKSEISSIRGRNSTEITLLKDGIMTVKKFNAQVEEKNYQISPAAIPDVFIEFIFGQMLDSDYEKIFVDIIKADGTILPALISRIETPRRFASLAPLCLLSQTARGVTRVQVQNRNSGPAIVEEETAYAFRMELLDGRGFSQQLYLDEQRRISKALLRQESIYSLERTTVENILEHFPEKADYVLQFPSPPSGGMPQNEVPAKE